MSDAPLNLVMIKVFKYGLLRLCYRSWLCRSSVYNERSNDGNCRHGYLGRIFLDSFLSWFRRWRDGGKSIGVEVLVESLGFSTRPATAALECSVDGSCQSCQATGNCPRHHPCLNQTDAKCITCQIPAGCHDVDRSRHCAYQCPCQGTDKHHAETFRIELGLDRQGDVSMLSQDQSGIV